MHLCYSQVLLLWLTTKVLPPVTSRFLCSEPLWGFCGFFSCSSSFWISCWKKSLSCSRSTACSWTANWTKNGNEQDKEMCWRPPVIWKGSYVTTTWYIRKRLCALTFFDILCILHQGTCGSSPAVSPKPGSVAGGHRSLPAEPLPAHAPCWPAPPAPPPAPSSASGGRRSPSPPDAGPLPSLSSVSLFPPAGLENTAKTENDRLVHGHSHQWWTRCRGGAAEESELSQPFAIWNSHFATLLNCLILQNKTNKWCLMWLLSQPHSDSSDISSRPTLHPAADPLRRRLFVLLLPPGNNPHRFTQDQARRISAKVTGCKSEHDRAKTSTVETLKISMPIKHVQAGWGEFLSSQSSQVAMIKINASIQFTDDWQLGNNDCD